MASSCVFHQLLAQPYWVILLFFLGSFTTLRTLFKVLYWVYVSFLRPPKNLKKYGSWAVVTGPTDGIGKGFAFQLARKGLNLVLVGRNPDKLRDVSDSIKAKFSHTQIKTVVVDFSGDLDEGVKSVQEAIEGLDVGVLINNVGVSYPYARYFHEVDQQLLNNLIKVNVEGTSKITHAVLPNMVKRRKGAIVNIGSGAAIVIPSDPLYSVYAATKAYIDQFSRCLYVEYKNMGIDVQCQVPLYVATKMASIKRSSFFVPSTDGYAKAGIRHIGYEPRCTPYWPHSFLWGLISCVPESIIDAWRLRFCLGIRINLVLPSIDSLTMMKSIPSSFALLISCLVICIHANSDEMHRPHWLNSAQHNRYQMFKKWLDKKPVDERAASPYDVLHPTHQFKGCIDPSEPFQCPRSEKCIALQSICDGVPGDCPGNLDENEETCIAAKRPAKENIEKFLQAEYTLHGSKLFTFLFGHKISKSIEGNSAHWFDSLASAFSIAKTIRNFAEKTQMSSDELAHFQNVIQMIHDGRLEEIPVYAQEAVNQGLASLVEKLYESGFMDQ